MKRQRKQMPSDSQEGFPEWMLTYSDLVTLLLTFFIMLFSMAVIDKQKFEQVATSLRSSFLHISAGEMFNDNKGKDMFSITEYNNSVSTEDSETNKDPKDAAQGDQASQNAAKLQNVKKEIEASISELKLSEYVKVIDEKYTITLRFDSLILFDLGSADMLPTGKDVLRKLGVMLKQLNNQIIVEGHTDDLPINTMLFPTNWELSTKRSTNVVIFLVSECGLTPQKLTAAGHGEFKPIMPNDSDINRQKNRRIDIVIEK